ncbi:MAG: hypothetical protein KDC54_10060, partial [Lewinella sp.]|nr:hypothetical protein [Lewinella sp.]
VVAVGRLAATSPEEVAVYLDKVIARQEEAASGAQTIADQAWKKDILHLGGGNTASEQQSIRTLLENMGRTLADSEFGARTTAVYKTSTDPIQVALSEQIFGRINEGVAMITFFGHSSAGTFDFSIDNPDNYLNYGKTPLMLSLGCYSGNMFGSVRSVGERFVLQPETACVAYGASRGIGFIHALGSFAQDYYTLMGGELYGASIAEGVQAAISLYEDYNDIAYGTLKEQFSLQGDPAITLHPRPGPDYTIDPLSVRFDPAVVSVQRDSFELAFDLYNLGRHSADSLTLKIEQELPDGERVHLSDVRVATPAYLEHLQFRLPTQGRTSVGQNILYVTVDSENEHAELPAPAAETNNELVRSNGQPGIPFFVIDNAAAPVWPPRYGLVGETPIKLKASTADAFAPERTYYFQLDTTPHFEEPLVEATVRRLGGVLVWEPDLNWQDSTVYYWRVSPDSSATGTGFVWEQSSFTYLSDTPPGWGQGHWGQYAENDLDNMEVEEREQLDFVKDFSDLYIRNNIYSFYSEEFRANGFVNGKRWTDFFRWNVHPSIQVVVIDENGIFWRNPNPGAYGSVNTSTPNAIAAFSFPVQTSEQRGNIINFLTEVIPDNHTVIVYNALRTPSQDMWIQDWTADSLLFEGQNLFNVLEVAGATQVRGLLEGDMRPYLFSYVQGGGTLYEEMAPDQEATINYNIAIPGYYTEGEMTTPIVGRALSWDHFFWKAQQETPEDTVRIQLIGILGSGEEQVLLDSVAFSGSMDLSGVSPQQYPFLRVQFAAEDRYVTTCPELNYWRIHYQGLPDLALQTGAPLPDSLQRGAPLPNVIEVVNITDLPVDSTRATLSVRSAAGEENINLPVPALSPEAVYVLPLPSTRDLRGATQIIAEVNPDREPAETGYGNNQGVLSFTIGEEFIQPVVDVTFDGRRILDGELVSARPYVRIAITDENPYLLLADTNLFQLDLVTPSGQRRRIRFDGVEAIFQAAQSNQPNRALIRWEPELTENGLYRLELLARDESNNPAGRLLSETNFEVINEQMISHFVPYPNPFTTQTRFIYTLTGDRPPAQLFVQIMTVSGRVVREISQAELGPLEVGTHQTDFVWDGTDDYGDRLANGVYLYRVVARDETGSTLPLYDNGTSDYFANGLGKIVLLR